MSSASRHGLKYRPDIDGLRAVAVVLVIGFHAFPAALPGGFIGVDIFFVISGYLITQIIVADLTRDRFSYSDFYLKRVLRIFPALILVLLATFVAGWFYFLPYAFATLGKSVAGGAAFVANVTQWAQSGYFDLDAEFQPLLHLWSLGIEEQFYLLWPPLLVLIFRRSLALFRITIGIAIGSCLANLFVVKFYPTTAFFWLPTRAWELMAGALLVIGETHEVPSRLRRTIEWTGLFVARIARRHQRDLVLEANIRAVLGLLLIAVATAFLNRNSTFPGWRALLPVIGTVLLLSAQESIINRRLLASASAVSIGLISYPLYLWHWPLLVFVPAIDLPIGINFLKVLAIASSVVLAAGTYAFLERPIRFGERRKQFGAPLAASMVTLAFLGIWTSASGGFEGRLTAAQRELQDDLKVARVDLVKDWKRGTCLWEKADSFERFSADCVNQTRRPLVIVWGDSVAAALTPGLRDRQAIDNFGLGQITTAGCPPIRGFSVEGRPFCQRNNDFALREIEKLKPEVVVLHSTWIYSGSKTADINATISALRALAIKKIVVIGPPPYWKRPLPDLVLKLASFSPIMPIRNAEFIDPYPRDIDRQLEQVVRSLDVEYISLWKILCNESDCLVRVGPTGRDLTSFDTLHLTLAASKYVSDRIVRRILSDRDQSAPR